MRAEVIGTGKISALPAHKENGNIRNLTLNYNKTVIPSCFIQSTESNIDFRKKSLNLQNKF